MPRKQRPNPHDRIEERIRAAGSIGGLERLAGIGPEPDARTAFWRPYASLPGAEGLDAGVAELKRRIRAGAAANQTGKRPTGRAQPQQP